MSEAISGTMDANAEEVGPVWVRERASVVVSSVSGTITVTPHVGHTVSSMVAVAAEALTAAGEFLVEGPCWLKLVASGVSGGGTAVGSILVMPRGL